MVLRSAEAIEITVAGAGAASSGLAAGTTQPTETGGEDRTGFQGMDIKTVEGADNMILAMDAALTQINTARADMGAVQNRFTSVIANLSTSIENLSAARSRIQDADFAKESAHSRATRSCSRPAPRCWPRPTRPPRACSSCCADAA